MVLICISLVTDDVEHVFIDLLAICISALDKCLFIDLAHLLIGFSFYYRVVRIRSTFYILVLCQIHANISYQIQMSF